MIERLSVKEIVKIAKFEKNKGPLSNFQIFKLFRFLERILRISTFKLVQTLSNFCPRFLFSIMGNLSFWSSQYAICYELFEACRLYTEKTV